VAKKKKKKTTRPAAKRATGKRKSGTASRATPRKAKASAKKAGPKRAKAATSSARAPATRAAKAAVGGAPRARRSNARPAGGKALRAAPGAGLAARDLEQFRQALLDKRAELIGDVQAMRDEALNKNRQDASGDLSNMPIHMADIGSDNYEQEFTLDLIDNERAILREIDEALERIRAGTYGLCAATGAPIGRARLRAKPWAAHCYDYVLEQEKKRRPRY